MKQKGIWTEIIRGNFHVWSRKFPPEQNRKRLRLFSFPFWITEQARLMYRAPVKYIHIAKCEQLSTAEW